MSFIPKPHEIYKHFKGNLYQITAIAEHSETGETLVVYQALYGDFKTYARPLDMFISRIDRDKYPSNKYPEITQEYRFELQGADADRQREFTACESRQAASQETAGETAAAETTPLQPEEPDIDPLLMEFLDSDTYEQKLNVLAALHHRITNEMITTMAIASDIEVADGDVEERYESLKGCLLTLQRYECSRLR